MTASMQDDRNAMIALGIATGVGMLAFFTGRRIVRTCTDLPDVWSEEKPLHLTVQAQKKALDFIRRKYRDYMISGPLEDNYSTDAMHLEVANYIQKCNWKSLPSLKAREVWDGLRMLVKSVEKEAESNPEAFLASVD